TQPFWAGKYEVTQAEYQAVMGSNPSWGVGSQRPVETVSWNNAMAYCATLTATEGAAGRIPVGYQYRLPTEAEWEYCCRAGTTTEYWCGSTISCGQGNFALNFHTGSSCSAGSTAVVGTYPANDWGLHDTAGNVWEWCLDAGDGNPNYPAPPPPLAIPDPYVSSGPLRVWRGGSYAVMSSGARSAERGWIAPSVTGNDIGFRIVLAPIIVP
ncbi:MAG: formylglycine-generating enzyme family protein, partial [Vicinamibacterales bacterium]